MTDAKLIDGKATAAIVRQEVQTGVAALKAKTGVTPGLAVVLVGEDPASQVYVRNKVRQTEDVGMKSTHITLPDTASEAALLDEIATLNADQSVHGILVQLPLPDHINSARVLEAIRPDKDVDGFHAANVGALWSGADALVPCTPLGCLRLLKDTLGSLSGKHAIVIGRSNIVGKPMAALLLSESATVTIAHSRTQDIAQEVARADIIVAAVGIPHFVKGEWIKEGATVIDVGINRIDAPEKGEGKTRLVGDVDFDAASQHATAITPVPGGVGPMTIATLLANTLKAATKLTSEAS